MQQNYPRYLVFGNMLYKKCYFIYKPLYYIYKRIIDRKKISFLKKFIKPRMRVVDIGANTGFYTVILSKLVGEHGMVYAFEPDQDNFTYLKNNTKKYSNILINQLAVSDKSGNINLYISQDLNVDHNTYDNGENRECVQIKAVSIDDFFQKNEIIDFIKTDTQGFDYFVIAGSKNTISRSGVINILTEFWPYGLKKAGVNPVDFLNLIKNMNLKIDTPELNFKEIEENVSNKLYSFDIIISKKKLNICK